MKDGASVNDSESLPEESQSQSQSSEGDISLKGEEKFVELLKKKDKAIEDLRSKVDELLEDKENRIDELESKKRLTESEEDELSALHAYVSSVKQDKKGKWWVKNIIPDISKEVSKDAVDRLDLAYAEHDVELLAEKENVDVDTFYPKIKKFMRQVDPEAVMTLRVRVNKAYKLMKRMEDFEKKEKELNDKEKSFAEAGGGRSSPKSQTREEILNWKESKNPTNSLKELLKGLSDSQEAERAGR